MGILEKLGINKTEDNSAPTMTEIGCTGLNQFSGSVFEETVDNLKNTKAVKVYKEMTSEPIIGAILFAMKMLIRNVSWRVERAGDEQEDFRAQAFLDSCLYDMSMSWTDTISEIVSFLPYGWSYHEIVYKLRLGESEDESQKSTYNDGLIGWRKLPIRAQDTLDVWEFDEKSNVLGMWQMAPPHFNRCFIPIDRALLFRTECTKNNPEGVSVLRSAYKPYYYKKRIDGFEGIGIERDLAGLPVFEIPKEYLLESATIEQKAFVLEIQKIIKRLKNDEQAGLILPQEWDENGNPKFKFSLTSAPGAKQIDVDKTIARKSREMAISVLADFILIGHEKVGSFSLNSSKTELFATAMGAYLKSIAEVFNRYAIPRLFKLNSFSIKKLPRLVPGDIESVDLNELGAFITAMANAGAPLFPDEELEAHLRKSAGLPTKGHSTVA